MGKLNQMGQMLHSIYSKVVESNLGWAVPSNLLCKHQKKHYALYLLGCCAENGFLASNSDEIDWIIWIQLCNLTTDANKNETASVDNMQNAYFRDASIFIVVHIYSDIMNRFCLPNKHLHGKKYSKRLLELIIWLSRAESTCWQKWVKRWRILVISIGSTEMENTDLILILRQSDCIAFRTNSKYHLSSI